MYSKYTHTQIVVYNMFRNDSDRQLGEKKTRSRVKKKACNARKKKAEGKQYANEHHTLLFLCILA